MPDVLTELVLDGGGRPMLRKRGHTADGRQRLQREAAALTRARHPGVVQVLDAHLDEPTPTLTLRWVGSHSLATIPALPVEQAAGMLAAVATTVADLHDLGMVHGRLSADHVVIGEGGRPLLCGFGAAALTGAAGGPHPDDDVAALGRLLHRLIADELESEPIPEGSRWRIGRRRWSGFHRRSLLTLADQATADDPSARPTARSLAASVRQAVPGARLPRRHDMAPEPAPTADPGGIPAEGAAPTGHRLSAPPPITNPSVEQPTLVPVDAPSRPRRTPAHRGAVAIVAVAAAVLVAIAGQRLGTSDPAPEHAVAGEEPATRAIDPAVADRARAVTSDRTPQPGEAGVPPHIACPATPAPRADVDDDGCEETLRVDGGTVTAGSLQFAVGRPGDLVVLGDWNCDGQTTVAIARPASREVFVFEAWAATDQPLQVHPTATANEVRTAQAVDIDGDGCHELLTVDAAGDTSVLHLNGRS